MHRKLILLMAILLSACQGVAFNPYWKAETPPAATVEAVEPINTVPAAICPISTPVSLVKPYVAIGKVNIRQAPSGGIVGVLYAGAVVQADCEREGDFCEVSGTYVLKACLGVGNGVCK